MGKIFCIIGKSCSGKDTVFKKLKGDKQLDLKTIVTYTTRPIRDTETNGLEYIFINKDKLEKLKKSGKIIECRTYDTMLGKWYYATVDDGHVDLNSGSYLVISTLNSFMSLKKYYKAQNVIPIYIYLDDGIRLLRSLKRESRQKKPNYNELCRRFLADNKDFSLEKLKACGIKKCYDNKDLKSCVRRIKHDIKNIIKDNSKFS